VSPAYGSSGHALTAKSFRRISIFEQGRRTEGIVMIEESRWTIRHDRAILALLQEPTAREAARHARISQATMTRWLQDPLFQARLQKERRELFTAMKTQLLASAQEAIGTLQIVQRDIRAPWTAKVQAARSVLALIVRLRESEIADQLDRLEDGDEDIDVGEVVQ
jgi:hypothetical protein